MEIEIDTNIDGNVELAYSVFMGATNDLRSAKRELESPAMASLAEALIEGRVYHADKKDVLAFSKQLAKYREAREYFVSPQGGAAQHAAIVGLDGLAAVSKMRQECFLEFNSMQADAAVKKFKRDLRNA
jgi:hypothetical protein